ncbi:MAG: hypothetical protein C0481_03820 [Phenylobacterium sp.]|nr:hypothetical protein [Phenylobacterium sp.]
MTAYRVIVVDTIGLLIGELEVDFETDLEAIAAVFLAEIPHQCELWCGPRLLGLFPASVSLKAPDASRPSRPRLGPA